MIRQEPAASVAVWLAVGSTILLQIAYPLVHGGALTGVTIASVLSFFAASVLSAARTRGRWWAVRFLLVTLVWTTTAEAIGVATGYPFGSYSYSGSLGPGVAGVPLLVPLAWAMMTYPALVAARTIAGAAPRRRRTARAGKRARWSVPLLGGWVLTAWDLFLDPQMVAAGHWTWRFPTPSIPGAAGVPLSNYVGWLVVATALIAILDRLLPTTTFDEGGARQDLPVAVLLAWTWGGSAVGNVAFFGRPLLGLVGAIALGVVVVPYLLVVWRTGFDDHSRAERCSPVDNGARRR